jgi:deoxyuridine 5''-triphosphate nucleotidohydrolase (dut)
VNIPETVPISVQLLRNATEIYGENGLLPSTALSVGIDLRACLAPGEHCLIPPGERRKVPTGLAIEPQERGIAGFVYSRSGLGAVTGIVVAQGVGIIDPDYRGEICVFLLNTGTEEYLVADGERIAQIVFQPYRQPAFVITESLGRTERGDGGFGHTGR